MISIFTTKNMEYRNRIFCLQINILKWIISYFNTDGWVDYVSFVQNSIVGEDPESNYIFFFKFPICVHTKNKYFEFVNIPSETMKLGIAETLNTSTYM